MKKILFVLSFIFSLLLASLVLAAFSYQNQKLMPLEEVKKRWGGEIVNFSNFKNSSYESKSKMAYSILKDKSLIGKSYEEIRELFGPNDGYYFNDSIPAYIVQDGKTKTDETWQLVFRMDRKHKVHEIFVHKNCCE